ncbi:salicylate hydroxylase [Moesziomyces antarcticus]|uniref:Salicylate hydroxylase n=2 Tax=Pseudozyma antarctica TaxID=84753 RepID=A0A081CB67_PSEA2|nr:salicylate hydroxylase [Moesziomyces antarcticus]GAK63913.1 salicylate hydroxylase [Moesziomyces antarcticus]SPO44877.1 probable Salicylate hydroxylase [Moesziomyces antarcticus]
MTSATSATAAPSSGGGRKDFNVAVVGGGIGGLTLAIGLHDRGVPVHIFESASKFAEIGAGIAIGPNAQNALQRLGLYESFLQFADFPSRNLFFQWRMGEGEEQRLLSETICKQYGMASIHRAELLDTFVKRMPTELCSFGKRLKDIQQPESAEGKVRITFEDGSTHDADLVIGCDGIHSRVRGALDRATAGPSAVAGSDSLVWSGSWAYRGLIPRERFVAALGKEKGEFYADTAQMLLAKDSHVLIFPIHGGKTVNIVAFRTDRSRWPQRTPFPKGEAWIQETSKDELMRDFDNYSSDVVKMVECIDKPSKWALHQVVPSLTSYINGRVIVAGDAAHGGVPHQGAMAGQAIEDALFLSNLLSHPRVKAQNLTKALGAYDTIRVPRANRVLESSLEAGDTYEFRGVAADDPAKLGEHLVERFDHIWDYDLDKEKQQMEEWLDANL